MLGDALIYPKSRDDWKPIIGVGAIVWVLIVLIPLFSLLGIREFDLSIVPTVLISVCTFIVCLVLSVCLLGYYIRVFRSAADADPEPPSFTDWKTLFIDGLKLILVLLLYGIIAGILIGGFATALVLGLGMGTQLSETSPSEFSGVAFAGFGFILIISLFINYIELAAIVRFAHEDRLAAAFEIPTIVRTAFTSEFFLGCVLSVFIGLVLGYLAAGFIPLLIGVFMLFYVSVTTCYLIGRGYGNAQSGQSRTTTRKASISPTD